MSLPTSRMLPAGMHPTRGLTLLGTLLSLCVTASVAHAQDGADETPRPITDWGADKPIDPDAGKEAPPPEPKGYPMELTLRPLTLDAGMSEVRLALPVFVDAFRVRALLRADYGINDQIQLGLTYGAGGYSTETELEGGAVGLVAGTAASIDFRYRITNWIAGQASVPMLFNRFSMGLTLGAPFKFSFLDGKLALFGGHDLVTFRVYRFAPDAGDPFYNRTQLADYDRNTTLSRGELRFLGGVIYQHQPNLAITGEMGVLASNFGITNAGVPLLGTITYSSTDTMDLGVRIGFDNLDQAMKNFGLTLFAARRI
jgi:hypothetical protein